MQGAEYVGIMCSPYYAYVIPRDLMCIDKFVMDFSHLVSAIYARESFTMPLNATGFNKMTQKDSVLVEYENAKGKRVYIKQDFLKKFGKSNELILKSESPKSVIHIYEKKTGFLIGYVMPFIMKTNTERE